MFMIMLL